MKKKLVVLVMLLAMLSNMFLSNKVSAYAFERNRSIVRTLSSLYFCATIVSTTKQSV